MTEKKKGGPKPGPRAGQWLPEHCTVADLAKLLNVSGRTVRDLDLRGLLKKDSVGFLTLDCIHSYLDHLRKSAAGRASGEQSLADARALDTKISSEIKSLKLKQLQGEVLTLDEVRTSWAAFATTIKAGVLTFPSKARAKIPHLTAHDAETLKVMCRDFLQDMSDEVKAAVIGANGNDLSGK